MQPLLFRFLDSLRSLEMTGGRLGRNDRGRQPQRQADGMFRTGLCKRYTSRRRAKAGPEEHISDAAAAAVLKRFLRALRLVEMTVGRLGLLERTGGCALV